MCIVHWIVCRSILIKCIFQCRNTVSQKQHITGINTVRNTHRQARRDPEVLEQATLVSRGKCWWRRGLSHDLEMKQNVCACLMGATLLAKDSIYKADTNVCNNNLSHIYMAYCCFTDNDWKSDFVAWLSKHVFITLWGMYHCFNNCFLSFSTNPKIAAITWKSNVILFFCKRRFVLWACSISCEAVAPTSSTNQMVPFLLPWVGWKVCHWCGLVLVNKEWNAWSLRSKCTLWFNKYELVKNIDLSISLLDVAFCCWWCCLRSPFIREPSLLQWRNL